MAMGMTSNHPNEIRAVFDDVMVRVYQAYNDEIADSALKNGTFVSPPFKMNRMTWIKPSFLWMMYRCGWGLKDINQRRILAVDMSRDGFDWALSHSCPTLRKMTTYNEEPLTLEKNFPVRIQWDPERDVLLRKLSYRTIQIGLSEIATNLYVDKWIFKIEEITTLARTIHKLTLNNNLEEAESLLPQEMIYPLSFRL